MKIAIIGTGGVGGYFGAKLALAGHDVHFLARGGHLKAMVTSGISVKSLKGDFHVDKVKASDNLQSIGKADLAIVSVKAWQVKEMATQLKHIVDARTMVLPLQNGVMASKELSGVLGVQHVLGGLCRIISKIEAPGVIKHFGVDPLIVFGELHHQITDRARMLQDVFIAAGINARAVDNIESELWKKFIAICVSGLLGITGSTYGEIRQMPETRAMMIGLFNEIYGLSQTIGIPIEADFVDKTVAYIDGFPFDATSSLARDVWDGKPSEIEYQNGTVVKLGERYHFPTPINRFVYHCILPMEARARQRAGLTEERGI
ncbi:MAG: 2-dehydropantoate 2-reductase [Breznakibacter sp.]